MVTQEMNRVLAAQDSAAQGCERLAEGQRDQVHPIGQAERCTCPPAVPEHPRTVRVIDEQPGAEPFAHLDDLRQRADVTVHRVHAVDENQLSRAHPAEGELRRQIIGVVVREEPSWRSAHSATIEQ